MQITGENLKYLHQCVGWAIAEIDGQIGCCPDVNQYEAELEDLEAEKVRAQKLMNRIGKAIEAEDQRKA